MPVIRPYCQLKVSQEEGVLALGPGYLVPGLRLNRRLPQVLVTSNRIRSGGEAEGPELGGGRG